MKCVIVETDYRYYYCGKDKAPYHFWDKNKDGAYIFKNKREAMKLLKHQRKMGQWLSSSIKVEEVEDI